MLRRLLGVALVVAEVAGAGTVGGVLAASLSAGPAGASSTSYGWTFQSGEPVSINSVSCALDTTAGTTTCFAVGSGIEVTTTGGFVWTTQTEPGGISSIAQVSCVSATTCWAAGTGSQGAAVIATTDGGATWSNETLPSGTPALVSISCVSTTDCWAVSGEGNIVATTDGGTTWSAQTTPPGINELNSISCASASDCWAVGTYTTSSSSYAVAISTTTGGTTWTAATTTGTTSDLPTGAYQLTGLASVSCAPNTTDCVAVGPGPSTSRANPNPPTSELVATTNGTSWVAAPLPSTTDTYAAVTCFDPSDCWAAGSSASIAYGSVAQVTGYTAGSGSTPAASPWASQSINTPTGPATPGTLGSIACASASDCWIAGSSGDQAGYSGFIASTTAGGSNGWYAQQTYPLSGSIKSIACTTTSDCWMAGGTSRGTVSYTVNGGETWSALAPAITNPASGGSGSVAINSYNAITCIGTDPSQTDCWAVGVDSNGDAEIDATTNGGSTWTLQGAPGGITGLTAIDCATVTDCWATSSGGSVIGTTDGGSTWTTETVPKGISQLAAISCANTSQCWAGGQSSSGSGFMIATGNGGASWSPETLPSGAGLVTGLACPSSSDCFAVDNSGDIIATTDSGAQWSMESSASGLAGSYNSITCLSTSDCWAAASNPRSVVATNDGGSVWAAQITPSYPGVINTVACANADDCWYGGNGGVVVTTNGGYSPAPVLTSLSPTAGIDSGGTQVTITGQNFTAATAVEFGTTPAASFRVVSDTQISAVTPQVSTPGSVNVTVTTNGGTSALSPADEFDFVSPAPKPDVTSVEPSSGPVSGGTSVVISGTSFTGATLVAFGPNTVTNFTVNSAGTQITATVPGGTLGAVNVTVTTAGGGTGPTNVDDGYVYVEPGGYTPLAPTRICDTRPGNSTPCSGQTLGSDQTLNLQVAGATSDLPSSGVVAVVMNVTAVQPADGGFLTVSPYGVARPLSSNLNFTAGQIVANLVEVELGINGEVSFYNGSPGSVNVLADVEGYVSASSTDLYDPLSPARICDTRFGNPSNLSGPVAQCNSKPLSAASSMSVVVAGLANVPSDATAVVLNVTMVQPQLNGFLTVYPSGTPPTASNVNVAAGHIAANRVIVPLSSSGDIEIYSDVATNVIVDVSGYFVGAGGTGSQFVPQAPARFADTRCVGSSPPSYCAGENLPSANSNLSAVGPGQSIVVHIAGVGSVPLTATAVVANVTVTDTSSGGFLTVYPGGTRPTVSDVNWTGPVAGGVPNLVVAILSSSGTISIYNNSGTVDVLVDVLGWYQ